MRRGQGMRTIDCSRGFGGTAMIWPSIGSRASVRPPWKLITATGSSFQKLSLERAAGADEQHAARVGVPVADAARRLACALGSRRGTSTLSTSSLKKSATWKSGELANR